MGCTGCITHCTIQNTTGHHRAIGLPAEGTAEMPAQRQDPARMERHPPGLSIHTETEALIWHYIPHRKSPWICEPRHGSRSDSTCHYCQRPTGGFCASHPFNFGLFSISMSQRGHTLATKVPLQKTQQATPVPLCSLCPRSSKQIVSHHPTGVTDPGQQEKAGLLSHSKGKQHTWHPGDPCAHLVVLPYPTATANRHVHQAQSEKGIIAEVQAPQE